ncbi:MAG: TonB-dependent receptor [Rhodanobacteraceae bacterium]
MSGKSGRASRRNLFQRKALAMAIGGSIALVFTGGAFAQAVSGTIQGTVPVATGESIQITGGAGYNRTITVGPSGRYSVTLPVGTYTVSLLQNGRVVQTRTDVTPVAAGAAVVDFTKSASAQPSETLSTVNVTAMAIPPIDVTTTNQVTTITAKQLQQLPLARTAENIALLAPGVQQASALLQANNPTPLGTPALSFGGASDAENACYIDGMDTTDQLTGQGCYTLPYGSIEQQQTFISGYGAKYGRSIGGVISQIGKSGSNEWHFGFRAIWQPGSLAADPVNQYYSNPASTIAGQTQDELRTYRRLDSGVVNLTSTGDSVVPGTETIYDAYVSGPIIKDKLTFFLGVEQDRIHANTNGPIATPLMTFATAHAPKIYLKLNWNINDNNILSFSGLQNQYKVWASQSKFDYTNDSIGSTANLQPTVKNSVRMFVFNYTSYLTNSLTLHAMFGKLHNEFYTQQPSFPGFVPSTPIIFSASQQDPAFLPPGSPGISNNQPAFNVGDPSHKSSMTNYRVSLDWKLPWNLFGTHDISVGIDNITTWDSNDGSLVSGPGYAWLYGLSAANIPLTGTNPSVAPYVGPPDSNPGTSGDKGYFVSQFIFEDHVPLLRVVQSAEYVNDDWQITPDFLLTLGLRNGTFVNYNSAGVPYTKNTSPNWMPRIGFSWNVLGDSTLKLFGNAGRYYITMPAEVALRGAGSSTFTQLYGTYTGVNPDGTPIGFQPLPMNNGGRGPTVGVSANNEYGEPLNPQLVSASNLKPEYSDNFVLGAQWQFVPQYVAGVTATYQKLGQIIDDWDDQQRTCAAGVSEGLTYMTPQTCTQWTQGAVLINPTKTADIVVTSPTGQLHTITVNMAQQGFQRKMKRDYYSLDLSMQHPWNGKWFAKADLVWAKSWGNTEGPVDSLIGQGGPSVTITEQWDFAQLMEYSNGTLPNDAKWQFKLYGAYAINPEWTVGANVLISSGHPKICLGRFGPNQTDPLGYGNAYHWCGGVPVPPGSTGYTPWTHELDLNVNYSPQWADHRLNFNAAVFNVFNNQTPLQYNSAFGTVNIPKARPNSQYAEPQFWLPPRSVRFMVSYDF